MPRPRCVEPTRRRTARFAPILAAAGLALSLIPANSPAGAVSVSQTFTIPSSGSFSVVGHGWGHGHGMSQYGAKGAAESGLSHQQILKFYYPGTSTSTVSGRILVKLTRDTTRNVIVKAAAGLKVRDLGTNDVITLPGDLGATRWRLEVSGTRTVIDYLAGSWKRYRTLDGDGQFERSPALLDLVLPDGSVKKYRGYLRAASPRSGSSDRDTVNVVAIDTYVKQVVGAEMPTSWSKEAVQAQSVAARTYGWAERAAYSSRYYHLCDTTACQVFGGVSAESAAGSNAVDATKGQILTYGGKPAFTQFSSSSGGWTSAGSKPYLVSKADPYDARSGNPNHDWSIRVNESRLESRYPGIGDLKKITVTQREGGGEWQGRAQKLTLVGGQGSVTISGDTLRSVLGLKSTWFSFKA